MLRHVRKIGVAFSLSMLLVTVSTLFVPNSGLAIPYISDIPKIFTQVKNIASGVVDIKTYTSRLVDLYNMGNTIVNIATDVLFPSDNLTSRQGSMKGSSQGSNWNTQQQGEDMHQTVSGHTDTFSNKLTTFNEPDTYQSTMPNASGQSTKVDVSTTSSNTVYLNNLHDDNRAKASTTYAKYKSLGGVGISAPVQEGPNKWRATPEAVNYTANYKTAVAIHSPATNNSVDALSKRKATATSTDDQGKSQPTSHAQLSHDLGTLVAESQAYLSTYPTADFIMKYVQLGTMLTSLPQMIQLGLEYGEQMISMLSSMLSLGMLALNTSLNLMHEAVQLTGAGVIYHTLKKSPI